MLSGAGLKGPMPLTEADFDWVLAVNKAFEVELSPLDRPGLEALVAEAAYAKGVDGGAFLIAFEPHAAYDSPNFLWFRDRFEQFLYIDRVAVAETHRRRKLAATLYDDLFVEARAMGAPRVVCEVNSDPPNPGSDAFHAALGFEVVGEARLEGRGKTVRYLAREI